MKNVMRFIKKGKLSPRYSRDSVLLYKDLTYQEEPITILDQNAWKLRMKEICSIKVQWKNHSVDETTWKIKKEIQDKYP